VGWHGNRGRAVLLGLAFTSLGGLRLDRSWWFGWFFFFGIIVGIIIAVLGGGLDLLEFLRIGQFFVIYLLNFDREVLASFGLVLGDSLFVVGVVLLVEVFPFLRRVSFRSQRQEFVDEE
jgi:hypothetical protein